MAETWLETDRLALRRYTSDDIEWHAAFYADEEQARYLGGVKSREQVEALMRLRMFEYYGVHPGLGVWLTTERATGRRVGFHLLNHVRGQADIQVGYGLIKDVWGRGYATEMARALVAYGFRHLGLPRIVAMTNLPHRASQHVLSKIGLRRGADRTLPDPFYAVQGPMAWFERDRDPWLADHPAAAVPEHFHPRLA